MADKVIEVPGLGTVSFPDTMSDEAISTAIQGQLHPEPAHPGPASAPLPRGLQPYKSSFPGPFGWVDENMVTPSIDRMGRGVQGIMAGNPAEGASNIIRGAAQGPLAPLALTNPLRAAVGIPVGLGAQALTENALPALGATPGASALGGDLAGMAAGGVAAKLASPEVLSFLLHPKASIIGMLSEAIHPTADPLDQPLGYSVKPGQVMTPRSLEPLGYKSTPGQPLQNIGALPLGYKMPTGESLPDVGKLPLGYKGPAPPSPRTIEDLPLGYKVPQGKPLSNRAGDPLGYKSSPGQALSNPSNLPLGGSVPPPPAPRQVEDLPLGYKVPPGQKMTPAEAKIAPTPTPTPQQTRPVSTDLTSNVQKLQEMGRTKDDKIAQHLFTQKVSPEDWMAMDEMTKNFHIKNADPKFRALGKGGPLGRSSEQAVRDVHTRLTELWGR